MTLPADFDMARVPRILGWGRPDYKVPPSWCAVIDADHGGSVLTACNGRWSASDRWDFLLERDRHRDAAGKKIDKCGACDVIAREQRTLEGLAELKHAPVIETRSFPDFDVRVVDNVTPALVVTPNRVERRQRAGDGFDFSDVYIDLGGESG